MLQVFILLEKCILLIEAQCLSTHVNPFPLPSPPHHPRKIIRSPPPPHTHMYFIKSQCFPTPYSKCVLLFFLQLKHYVNASEGS
jgi:hypothetical protein